MDTLLNLSVGQVIGGIAGIVIILSVFIEITPIKINPVSSFLKWLGKKINGDVMEKFDELDNKVNTLDDKFNSLEEKIDADKATTCRIRILRFGDEIRMGQKHSYENFNQVLDDIKKYKEFCKDHEKYPNDKATITMDLITNNYQERLSKNDFL